MKLVIERDYNKWTRWFAWHPVEVGYSGESRFMGNYISYRRRVYVWLRWIERRRNDSVLIPYAYREIGK